MKLKQRRLYCYRLQSTWTDVDGTRYNLWAVKIRISGKQTTIRVEAKTESHACSLGEERQREANRRCSLNPGYIDSLIPQKHLTSDAFRDAAKILENSIDTDCENPKKIIQTKKALISFARNILAKYVMQNYAYTYQIAFDPPFRDKFIGWCKESYKSRHVSKEPAILSSRLLSLIDKYPKRFSYIKSTKQLAFVGVMTNGELEKYLKLINNPIEKEIIQRLATRTTNIPNPAVQTINNQISMMNKFLKTMEDINMIPSPQPLKRLRKKKQLHRGVVSPQELELLLRHSSWHLQGILMIAWCGGMRAMEILSLKLSDIFLDKKFIVVRSENSKSGKERIVLLPEPEDIPFIYKYFQILEHNYYDHASGKLKPRGEKINRSEEFLFRNREGTQIKSIKTEFNRVRRISGLTHITLHWLRHTYISEHLKNMSLVDVSAMVGHSSLESTMCYAHNDKIEKLRNNFNMRPVPFQVETNQSFSFAMAVV